VHDTPAVVAGALLDHSPRPAQRHQLPGSDEIDLPRCERS
jgi:hypothetical protein